jgi:hypothetical protein
MEEVSSGGYSLTRSEFGGGDVYQNGERIGNYWPDKYGGFAVFRTGNAKPVARLKAEAGCIRKLTHGAWSGKDDR